MPTEVTDTTAPSSPPTTGPAGDMGPDLGTNPPKDIKARARRSTHDQSNIMHGLTYTEKNPQVYFVAKHILLG